MFFAVLWLVSICLATAATHDRADLPPLLGSIISGLSQVGEVLFPVIVKYRTQLTLSETRLFRLQGVASSIWLAALATMVIYYLRLLLFTPQQRVLVLREMSQNLKRSRYAGSTHAFLLCLPFLLLFCVADYAGWLSFGDWDGSRDKGCYSTAACYAELHGFELIVAILLNSLMMVWPLMILPGIIWYFLKRDTV